MSGVIQIILFVILLRLEEGVDTINCLKNQIWRDPKTTIKMSLPPILLILSDKLMALASYVLPEEAKEASAFHIGGIALCSYLILKKKFLMSQILAIALIVFGQLTSPLSFLKSDIWSFDTIYGNVLIMGAAVSIGLSYTILEHFLKISDVSLWIRGIQFNLFNVPICLIIAAYDHYNSKTAGFFDDFNIISWFLIIFLVARSMIELFVVKVADSIFRIISFILASVLMNIMQTYPFATFTTENIGYGFILAGIILYTTIDLANPVKVSENEYQNDEQESSYVIPIKLYHSVENPSN